MKRTFLYAGLMLGIAGFTITATPAALAQTFDKNWTGGAMDSNWFTDNNWSPAGEPQAGDTVRIDGSGGVVLDIEIEDGDAECESIVMDHANILLKGRKFTLGLTATATTNDVTFGQVQFFDDITNDRSAQLIIRNWVEFTGNERLYVHGLDNTEWRPYIERANYQSDGGIRVLEDFDVIGHFTLYVSVYHDGGDFGVFSDKDTMVFGNDADPFDPDLEISGVSLNDEIFTADRGKIIFYQMDFDGTAPKWVIRGTFLGGEITGKIILQSGQITNVPNDIDLERYSLLEIHDDQIFNGKLYMDTKDTMVRVKDGAAATFVAP